MRTAERRAFSLMEMLVITMVIGLLVAMLLPVLSGARRSARAAQCQNNLSSHGNAMGLWLKDHQDVYPGTAEPYEYKDAQGQQHEAYVTEYNLTGKSGAEGDTTPAEGRLFVMNKYLELPDVSQCPMDRGTREEAKSEIDSYDDDSQTQFTVSDYSGSSYFYAARVPKEIDDNRWAVRYGVWMIGGHRQSQIENPQRKLIFADAVFNPKFSGDNPLHYWHNNAEPLTVNVAYADGHVADVPRKTLDRFPGIDDENGYDFKRYYEDPTTARDAIRKLLAPSVGSVPEDSPYY